MPSGRPAGIRGVHPAPAKAHQGRPRPACMIRVIFPAPRHEHIYIQQPSHGNESIISLTDSVVSGGMSWVPANTSAPVRLLRTSLISEGITSVGRSFLRRKRDKLAFARRASARSPCASSPVTLMDMRHHCISRTRGRKPHHELKARPRPSGGEPRFAPAAQSQALCREVVEIPGLLTDFIADFPLPLSIVRGVRDGTDLEAELRYARFLNELRTGTNVMWIGCEAELQHLVPAR